MNRNLSYSLGRFPIQVHAGRSLYLLVWACIIAGVAYTSSLQAQSRFDYSRYETENLRPYRNVVEFVYPELELGGLSTSSDSSAPTISPIDVTQFFSDSATLFIDTDPVVQSLVDRHKYLNSRIKTANGWRIQIIATSNRKLATNYQYQFESRYPPYQAYMSYESPNYKVRAGDFLKENDAELFRERISSDYPDAFLVNAKVRVPKYKGPTLPR